MSCTQEERWDAKEPEPQSCRSAPQDSAIRERHGDTEQIVQSRK